MSDVDQKMLRIGVFYDGGFFITLAITIGIHTRVKVGFLFPVFTSSSGIMLLALKG